MGTLAHHEQKLRGQLKDHAAAVSFRDPGNRDKAWGGDRRLHQHWTRAVARGILARGILAGGSSMTSRFRPRLSLTDLDSDRVTR